MRRALPILTAAAAVSLGCIGYVSAATSRAPLRHEVLVEVANSASPQTVSALQRRHRLRRIEQQAFRLAGTTLYRWRIPDSRSVAAVVRSLQGDTAVTSAQPNYLFTLTDKESFCGRQLGQSEVTLIPGWYADRRALRWHRPR